MCILQLLSVKMLLRWPSIALRYEKLTGGVRMNKPIEV